jgi:hypothetical protein
LENPTQGASPVKNVEVVYSWKLMTTFLTTGYPKNNVM